MTPLRWTMSQNFFSELRRNDINRETRLVHSYKSDITPPLSLICKHLSNNDQYHDLDTAHKALNGEQAETVIFAPPLTRQSPSQWDATASVTQIVENVWVRDGDTRR